MRFFRFYPDKKESAKIGHFLQFGGGGVGHITSKLSRTEFQHEFTIFNFIFHNSNLEIPLFNILNNNTKFNTAFKSHKMLFLDV